MNSGETIRFRVARRADLAKIVSLLADDDLGQARETENGTLSSVYTEAFNAIEREPNNEVIVAEDNRGLVGTMQLTYIANLTFKGATRCQIEGVRIAARARGEGLGERMFRWAADRARENGCRIVQLTSNKARDRALAFYEKLGYEPSHVGFKLYLD